MHRPKFENKNVGTVFVNHSYIDVKGARKHEQTFVD